MSYHEGENLICCLIVNMTGSHEPERVDSLVIFCLSSALFVVGFV
jgi:hypothetical protein